MNSIVTELKEIIKSEEKRVQDRNGYIILNKVNDRYNEMIKKGTIKKRGYTLRGIEDSHLINIRFNSKS